MNTSPTPAPHVPLKAVEPSERQLDAQVEGTFPASDPLSATASATATQAENPHRYVTLYRVVSADDAEAPFSSGAGRGGRWCSSGQPVVYAALSPAGAVLEFLAHLEGPTPKALRLAVATMPAECLHPLAQLPPHWDERPYREDVRRVGDSWAREGSCAALQVPSALVPRERNVLINVRHPDFDKLQVLSCDALRLDERVRI
ncbi:MAG TPA: RES family NAD+ phosphorylase [Lysobacter sp.]|nr:RES family NAD+ phosphorylase [Lysobacter sp.]